MSDKQKAEPEDREDDATTSRTLDEIEDDEHVPTQPADATTPKPDEGSGRARDDGGAGPM